MSDPIDHKLSILEEARALEGNRNLDGFVPADELNKQRAKNRELHAKVKQEDRTKIKMQVGKRIRDYLASPQGQPVALASTLAFQVWDLWKFSETEMTAFLLQMNGVVYDEALKGWKLGEKEADTLTFSEVRG